MVPTPSEPPPAPLDPVSRDARVNYSGDGLDQIGPTTTPLVALRRWYADALADGRVPEVNAMVLATTGLGGLPDARTVLLKELDDHGFVFYTNTRSTKAEELAADSRAALVLPWHPMHRQVRARGPVEPVERAVAEQYFQSRPRGSQVAAWASAQSQPIADRAGLVEQVAAVEARFAGADVLPLPDFWGGYRLRPVEIEFWVGQLSRLHDRWTWQSLDGTPPALDSVDGWRTFRRQP